MNYCKLCDKEFDSIRNLAIHISHTHNLNSREYYDKFLKSENDDKCVICGKATNYKNLSHGYFSYCSKACVNKSDNHIKSVATTKSRKYGNSSYNNPKKISDVLNSKTAAEKQQSVQKAKRTKFIKYGDENYNNMEKHSMTCSERFGVDNPFKSEEVKKVISDKYWAKSKEERNSITQRRLNTMNAKSDEEKRAIAYKHKLAYDNKSDIEKRKIQEKSNETKRRNNSFKKSEKEAQCKKLLESKFNDVKTQYSSDKYPFNCDFYIVSSDLYIECNFHWTHGKHKFDENNIKDIQTLELWKSKGTKYFNNAINTWTKRDISKFYYAEINNLNYLAFYSFEDFMKWYTSI